LTTISIHLTLSIVSIYNTIPQALTITAFVVGFLFAASEAAATLVWRRRGIAFAGENQGEM
jgi:hypothetical protein